MISLSNIKIGTKLGAMSGIGILLTAALCATLVIGNAKIKNSNAVAVRDKDISHMLTRIEANFVAVRLNVRNIRLARNKKEFTKAGDLAAKKSSLDQTFAKLLPMFEYAEDRDRAIQIQSGIDEYIDHAIQRTVPTKLAELHGDPKNLALMKETYDKTQVIQFTDLDPIGDKAIALSRVASATAAKHANASIEAAADAMRSSQLLSLAMSVVVILVLIGSALVALWSVAKPLSALAGLLQRMAKDEQVEITRTERKDEIGQTARAVNDIGVMLAEKARREAEEKAAADRTKAQREAEDAARTAEEREAQEKRAAAERDAAMQKAAEEFQAAVGSIVNAAVAGDFSQRVDLNGKTGLVLNVGTAINSLCENVAKALDDLGGMLNALAAGDLTQRITAHYEGSFALLKDNANMTADRIGSTVADIKSAAREVTNASMEITQSTTDLSQRTEEQAASLEETSSSMEEIASTVKKNAESAQQANQSAISTREVAGRGNEVVAQAVTAMAHIEESSRNIAEIIGVIDEIARQTNLLALNAAVEAARAGDAGRGFAVVASEVRSLAQRSSQAAKDIKDLIVNSGGQVKEGVELVNRAGAALTEITESIKQVADLVSDIAAASEEQSSGIDQVNKALSQMDEVTQQNSALVEENAATAKTLESQAKAMDERIAFFRLNEEVATAGGGARAPRAPVPADKSAAAPHQAPKPAAAAANNSGGRARANPVARMQNAIATAWKDF